jgi:hypothetical protein
MVAGIKTYLQENLLTADLLNRTAVREAKCDKTGGHPVAELDEDHLLEALAWLMRAHNAMPYGGLSRGYSFGWNPYFPKRGWQPAHPKTTGGIIPTLFDCAIALGREELRQIAVGLANWLIKIQLPSGAIRGGALDEPPSSGILNTAQAIIGWTRAFQETETQRYAEAARRASDFLLQRHDPEDSRDLDPSPSAGEDSIVCRSRTGWALIQVGIVLEEYQYCAAGDKEVLLCLQRQQPNGWFVDSHPGDSDSSLVQTIAHCLEGILQSSLILDNKRYFNSAKKSADALLSHIRDDGSLSGLFASDWTPRASWSCLLGDALMASIWIKLHGLTGKKTYLKAAHRMIVFLKKTQNCTTAHPGLRGGIKGSFPCDGEFGRYQTLSAGSKYFIDSLLSLAQVLQA